jgi:hypothetical protein
MTFAVTIVGLMTFAQSAHAREHHYRHGHRHHIVASRGMSAAQRSGWSADSVSVWGSAPTSGIFAFAAAGSPSLETRTAYRGRDRGRPEAWCGWEMRHLVGADPGPSFNLARNWAHWGRPGAAGIGAVVVWPHHVGKIVGRENGQWVVQSGNDGHAVRTRARSIAGAIALRWG